MKIVRFLPTLSICFTATGGDETCAGIYSSALVSVYLFIRSFTCLVYLFTCWEARFEYIYQFMMMCEW